MLLLPEEKPLLLLPPKPLLVLPLLKPLPELLLPPKEEEDEPPKFPPLRVPELLDPEDELYWLLAEEEPPKEPELPDLKPPELTLEDEPELKPLLVEPELKPLLVDPELNPLLVEPELNPLLVEPELNPLLEPELTCLVPAWLLELDTYVGVADPVFPLNPFEDGWNPVWMLVGSLKPPWLPLDC